MARVKATTYRPSEAYLALVPPDSGNAINGLGEPAPRRALPSFWHPADQQPFGAVARMASETVRNNPRSRDVFAAAHDHPPLVAIAERRAQ